MYLGLYASELVGTLLEEHDPHADLFDRMEFALTDLSSNRTEETFLSFYYHSEGAGDAARAGA